MKPGRKPLAIFDGVDLTRPADELANEIGCSIPAIYHARRRFGVKADLHKKLSLDGVDCTRPAYKIAKELRVSPFSVIKRLRLLGIPVLRKGKCLVGVSKFTHAAFDWSKTDTQLKPLYDCSREYIRQLRKKAGEPASSSKEWADKYHPVKTSQRRDT